MHKTTFLVGLIIFSALFVGCSNQPVASRAAVQVSSPPVHARLVFSDYDRTYIRGYYQPRGPRGMAGHGRKYAPPFRLHQPLPRHLSYSPLPAHVERRLPPLPAGYIRVMVGSDVVIMNARTRIVYDAIWDLR